METVHVIFLHTRSEILPWDRKSYRTHAISPGCHMRAKLNSHTLSSTDLTLKRRHHVKLYLSVLF